MSSLSRFCITLGLALAAAIPAAPAASQNRLLSIFLVSEENPDPPPLPPCGLCEILQDQVQDGCRIGNDSPYADTAYLRLGVSPSFDDAVWRNIGLARMSGDAEFAAELLAPILSANDPEARYAAGLTVATLLVQNQGGFDTFSRDMLELMEDAITDGMRAVPPSDYHFLRALYARNRGDIVTARQEIATALALEPRFFGAMIVSLDMALDRALSLQSQGSSLCHIAYEALLLDAARILDLAPCRYHAAHLDLYLNRQFSHAATNAPLAAVQVYLGLVSGRTEMARAARDRFAQSEIADCSRGVLTDLDNLIESQSEPLE